jgi:hypothetical protein
MSTQDKRKRPEMQRKIGDNNDINIMAHLKWVPKHKSKITKDTSLP